MIFIFHQKNYILLRIHYTDISNIDKILNEYFKKDLISNIYYSRYNYYPEI